MKCRLCESEARLYAPALYEHSGQSYDLARCDRCGIVFVDPFPDEETVNSLYNEEYFLQDYSFGSVEGDYLASEAARVDEYRHILSRIARLTNGRNLLEVGCAAGGFLKEAKAQGWKVTGVDLSPWAVKVARERFSLDVRQGSLEDMKFGDNSFDAVFFGDLVEHLSDPIAYLTEVARVVKPRDQGGVVVSKVPTYVNSFYYRWLRGITDFLRLNEGEGSLAKLLKLSDTAEKLPPYHLYEYGPSTVRYVFQRGGLEVFDEERTLLVPEFLSKRPDPLSKIMLGIFSMMRLFIETFGLPGGHVLVFAAPCGDKQSP